MFPKPPLEAMAAGEISRPTARRLSDGTLIVRVDMAAAEANFAQLVAGTSSLYDDGLYPAKVSLTNYICME
jgi:hypothetical protein